MLQIQANKDCEQDEVYTVFTAVRLVTSRWLVYGEYMGPFLKSSGGGGKLSVNS